jgi:hypothetical protein
MRKLITLGCSLTHHAGWAQYINECTKFELHNLSRSAGSNQLQLKKFQEFIFRNEIKPDDIVIWQITSTYRYYKREKINEKNQKQLDYFKNNTDAHPTVVSTEKNIFDNKIRVDHLCNSLDDRNEVDEAQVLEDVLFYLIFVRKFTSNFFVFLGWQEAVLSEHRTHFLELLKKYQIEYIDKSLVDWCYQNNLKFDLKDHPTIGSSSLYAKDVLIPAIENKLNITINRAPIWAE